MQMIRTHSGLPALLLTALCVVCAPGHGRAESGSDLTIDDMVDLADEVVVAEVVDSRVHWEGNKILTTSSLQVEESWKGEPGSEVEIVQIGGTAVHPVLGSEIRMEASGFVSLETGESVVLFMKRDVRNRRHLVSGAQGKFRIERQQGGIKAMSDAPKSLEVTREGRDTHIKGSRMTLDTLEQKVRKRIEARRIERKRRGESER